MAQRFRLDQLCKVQWAVLVRSMRGIRQKIDSLPVPTIKGAFAVTTSTPFGVNGMSVRPVFIGKSVNRRQDVAGSEGTTHMSSCLAALGA